MSTFTHKRMGDGGWGPGRKRGREGKQGPGREPALVFFLLLCLLLPFLFHGSASGNLEAPDPEKTREEIRELEKVARALDDSIKERQARMEELEGEMVHIEEEIERAKRGLAEGEDRFAEHNLHFAGRVRSAYIKGGISYLGVILEAESFGDLIVRTLYLQRILSRDAGLIDSIKAEQAYMAEQRRLLAENQTRLEDRQYQVVEEHRNLMAQRQEYDALLKAARERLEVELDRIAPQAQRVPVYGIILDNHTAARPQAGLARASLVYEYEVEGRITRYLALFAQFPSKVGPMRSSRTHSAMLALENDIHFIYASASRDVRETIQEWGIPGTNALASGSSSFYRDPSRRAPHNLYVNLATLGAVPASSQVVVRPAYVSRKGSSGTTLSIEYGSSTRVQYRYSPDLEAYQRYLNGTLQRDASGTAITVRNIVVQYAPHSLDPQRRPTPDLLGSGPMDFYVQGQKFQGTWSKDSIEAPTRFFYQDGQPVEFVYGPTWIQIVRSL